MERGRTGVMLVGLGGGCRALGREGVSDTRPEDGRELSGFEVAAAETGRLVAWGICCEHRQVRSVPMKLSESRSAAEDIDESMQGLKRAWV